MAFSYYLNLNAMGDPQDNLAPLHTHTPARKVGEAEEQMWWELTELCIPVLPQTTQVSWQMPQCLALDTNLQST